MPDTAEGRAAIRAELARIEESCMYSSQGQFEASKTWRGWNRWLGSAAAVLAAVAGSTALASDSLRLVVGGLALTGAFVGAIVTTVNPSQREIECTDVARAYQGVQAAARQAREIDLPRTSYEEARTTLSFLTDRWQTVNQTAPPISGSARKRAKTNIEGGGQSYAVDEGSAT